MIEKCAVNIPVTVEFKIHKGEKETGTHDHVEIYNTSICKKNLLWDVVQEIMTQFGDRIEDECFFQSENTSYIKPPSSERIV